MTNTAGFGPPGQDSLAIQPLAPEDNLVVDPARADRYRCTEHDLRLEVEGSLLTCSDGCFIIPPDK